MPGPTRRTQRRAATVAELKRKSWKLMASSGVGALSLRELARQMGMAPSAIYRYYDNRNDLLTALIVDGYDSLATELATEYEQMIARDPKPGSRQALTDLGLTYRRWALGNRVKWLMIFSSTVPDYTGTDETTAASTRMADPLLRVLADAAAADELDTTDTESRIDDELGAQLREWSTQSGIDLPPAVLAVVPWCFVVLHGAVSLELNRQLPPALQGSEAVFTSSLSILLDTIFRD